MTHNLELQVSRTKDGVKVSEGDRWVEGVTFEHALHGFRKKYSELYGIDTEATEYAVVLPLKEIKSEK